MTRSLRIGLAALTLASGPLGLAVDHDNLGAGRPLRFDDAESLSFREMAVEFGVVGEFPRRRTFGLGAALEFQYGVLPDSHLSIGVEPHWGGHGESFEFGAIELGFFHSFRQEIRNHPAVAAKVGLSQPTERGESTLLHLRGIVTKTGRQYDRWHLNLDAEILPDPKPGERRARYGAILGASLPLGYPRSFDTTGLAELAFQQGPLDGQGWTLSAGLGLRRQITPRAVIDFGIQSDLATGRGMDSVPFRFLAGYSTNF